MMDLLLSRRSIRKYRPDPVSEDSIRRILEAAHTAPSAILAFLDEKCLPSEAGKRMEGERLLLVHSVAAAVQNMLLAAHSEGLGACWICAPAFCPRSVREALE